MRVVQNNKPVNLTDKEYIFTGGEGTVYGKADTVYKVYLDPGRCIPPKKIKELSALTEPNIIRPLELLFDETGSPIGFTMRWVKDGIPLARLFSSSFRRLASKDKVQRLIEEIKDTTNFIHHNGCLVVDGNEFNYLVSPSLTEVFFLDVDSYQTPSFRATAIKPNIRDWHSKEFSSFTDWFSYGIIVCQMLIGLHPYKGTHPSFANNDMEGRMKANVSIFNPKTRIPASVNLNDIPSGYRQWFEAMFEKEERTFPPENFGSFKLTQVQTKVTTGTNQLDITLIKDTIETKPVVQFSLDAKGNLQCVSEKKRVVTTLITGKEVFTVDGFTYILQQDKVTLLSVLEIRDCFIVSPETSWNILPNSTALYDGVLISHLFSKAYILFPDGKNFYSIPVPELNGMKIIDAVRRRNVIIVHASESGKEWQFILRLKMPNKYTILKEDGKHMDINFTVLDNGVVLMIEKDGELRMFLSNIESKQETVLKDPVVSTTMKLWSVGSEARITEGNKVYKISMRIQN